MPQRNVDAHGSNLTAITGSTGDQTRSLHDCMPQFVATELERIGASILLRRRATGRPPASSRTFPSPFSGLRQPTRRSSSSMASFRISSLMPVAQDSASFCTLQTRRAWMVSRLLLISRAWVSVSHQTTFPSAPNKDSSSPSTAGQLRRHHSGKKNTPPVRTAGRAFPLRQ